MVTGKRVLSGQMLVFSAYIVCWYSGVLSYFTDKKLINYFDISLLGATALIAAGIIILVGRNPKKWMSFVLVVLNILLLILLVFAALKDVFVFWILLISALTQGLWLGYIFLHSLSINSIIHNLAFMLLGFILGTLSQFLPFGIDINDINISSVGSFGAELGLVVFMILLLIIAVVLLFICKSEVETHSKNKNIDPNSTGLVKYAVLTLAAIYLLIEVVFYFWSVVLIRDNQGLISRLTFPLVIMCVFIFRMLSQKVLNKISNIGWLFTLSILLCVSLGMFYTLSFTPVFIIGFGFSAAFLIYILFRLFHITPDYKSIASLLILASVTMIVCGLYIQNHIEFIRSINMPDAVINLSARQAIVKELASFAGIAVILSGYLFLSRRRLFS